MLELYGHPFSSYTWKALIPLYANETPYQFREVGPDPANGEFVQPAHAAEIDAGRRGLRRAYAWLERWLEGNLLPPDVSLVTCAAAPSLFYADWVEPIPADCPKLAGLRAELLALPAVSRCVEDARPYRAYFPPGAPDRD